MNVIMVILICGWGPYAKCEIYSERVVSLEYCQYHQATMNDDHFQVKCLRETNT